MSDEKTTNVDLRGRKVLLHDMCLRDGMHAKREQISVEQMVKVATALDDAGVQLIQVTHGGGLGGNSLQLGFALASIQCHDEFRTQGDQRIRLDQLMRHLQTCSAKQV
jgi:4-hydroxy-2-oxovalerate/4-hydroxy-2-oxohexanoate aldolase